MGSKHLPPIDSGIYHSLPQFDSSIQGLHAVITGGNGISGFGTLRCLLEHPKRWTKITLISRRPLAPELLTLLPPYASQHIEHISCDLQKDPEAIRAQLGDIQPDYIFYYAYLQPLPPPGAKVWSNDEELVRVNAGMLRNFLDAISLAGIKPKRFLLQTGGKNYGAQFGRSRMPALESDPQPKHLGPNFYYAQEDALFEYCEKNEVGWNIIMPPWIIGAVNTAQMNALFPWAVYAAVAAERNEPLVFPYDFTVWQNCCHHSTARLTGYLSEWAALEDKCRNERFNAQDTSPLAWERLFEALAKWFGVSKGFQPPGEDESQMHVVSFGGKERNPLGYGPPMSFKLSFSMESWAQDERNIQTYKKIMEREKLTFDPFEKSVTDQFAFADASATPHGPQSMSKARRLGWTGYVDTLESIFEMYEEMHKFGMAPAMKVKESGALV